MKKKILFGVSLLFGLMFINSGLNKFFYYISCKYAPPIKNLTNSEVDTVKIINTDAEKLFIDFNSDSIITNSGVMLP